MSARPLVLTIGAFDVSAVDGIVADAAVIEELGCRAACAATCVVVRAGQPADPLPTPLVLRQFEAAFDTGAPRAVRLGAMGSTETPHALAESLAARMPVPIVLAPEFALLPPSHRAPFHPLARLLVVRGSDLESVAGETSPDLEGLRRVAASLRSVGLRAVLIAGVPLRGRIVDLLDDDGRVTLLDAARVHAPRVPGLAGAHAVALAAHLARGGSLAEVAEAAQRYVGLRLQRAR